MLRPFAPCAALAVALTAGLASAASAEPYHQAPAVLARYADVPVRLDAPALRPGRTDFTSDAELTSFLADLGRRSPKANAGSLGRSSGGRQIPYIVFGEPAAGRPTVWFIGQQHGNEPAGCEALLALASALADGELSRLLERLTVVIVPRANPDGAAAHRRRTGEGRDMNRDHLLAGLPETRALHAKMSEFPPDIVVDAHEFAAAGRWLTYLGGLAPWDAMVLEPTHPAAPPALVALTREVFVGAVESRLAAHGLATRPFVIPPTEDSPLVPTGGTAPGIARNYFGLTGSVSLLVETRGGDTGREGLQRRIATHYLAGAAVLETAAAEAGRLTAAVRSARSDLARGDAPLPIAYAPTERPGTLLITDPASAADREVSVRLHDSRDVAVTATRAAPEGYIVRADAGEVLAALSAKGVLTCRLEPGPVAVEVPRLFRIPASNVWAREAINGAGGAAAEVRPDVIVADERFVFVPMRQAAAAMLGVALEADAPGGYLAGNAAGPVAGSEPIVRVRREASIRTAGCGAPALAAVR